MCMGMHHVCLLSHACYLAPAMYGSLLSAISGGDLLGMWSKAVRDIVILRTQMSFSVLLTILGLQGSEFAPDHVFLGMVTRS